VHLVKYVCFLNLSTHRIHFVHAIPVVLQILYLAFRVFAFRKLFLIRFVHFNGEICLVILLLCDGLSYPLEVDNDCIVLIVLLIMKIIIAAVMRRGYLFFLLLVLMAMVKIDGLCHFLHKQFPTAHSSHIVRSPISLLFRHRMTLTYI
jgi:hypothetical protein